MGKETAKEKLNETERPSLQELNLVDNFLFGSVVNHPEVGERFSRLLLKVLLQKEFKRLKVFSQRVLYGKEPGRHGVRLDLYLEAEEAEEAEEIASVYDVEPDKNRKDKKDLPFRIRFYHSKIDNGILASGKGYGDLKRVIVIMILTYDPFGLDRMLYTIRSRCEEEPEMPYDDGAATLLFYTRGKKGIPSERIRDFLRYMEHSTPENATDEVLRDMHGMVETIRENAEVATEFMVWMETDERRLKEFMERGELKNLVQMVCRKLQKNLKASEIADLLEESVERVEEICEAAAPMAPDYDVEAIVDQLLTEKENQ